MATKLVDLSLGSNRLVVMREQLTWDALENIASAYAEVKQKHSIFGQYPMADNETVEDWATRVDATINEGNKKKDDETYNEYLKRAMTRKLDKQELVKDTIRALAKIFGQEEKVTDEGFKASSYPECKDFLITVFEAVDLSTVDFV